jgi:thiamine-monophosphate kinase
VAPGDQAGEDGLGALGEFGLIRRLTDGLVDESGTTSGTTPGVEFGVGDDAAVLVPTPGKRLVVTVDVLVDGSHFAADLSGPADWGWKAIAVNVSDLAAMGAEPLAAVLALTVPPGTSLALLDELYAGVAEACQHFRLPLVGGDTTAGPVLSLAVTAIGQAGRPVRRDGARPGDRLVVTGPLGAAAAGLALLRRGDAPARALLDAHPHLAAAHRRPQPDLAVGARLAEAGALAMLDVSDGLAGDAAHLAEASGTGLEIDEAAVPLAAGVAEAAGLLGLDPVELALGGGEDYVLAAALGAGVLVQGAQECGRFTADPARLVRLGPAGARPLAGLAWDHFRPRA